MYLPLTASFLSLMFFTGLCVLHRPTGSLQGAQCTRQSMDGATAPVNVSCVDTSSPADSYVYTACQSPLLHLQVILMIHITIVVVLVASHITIIVVFVANHITILVVFVANHITIIVVLVANHIIIAVVLVANHITIIVVFVAKHITIILVHVANHITIPECL